MTIIDGRWAADDGPDPVVRAGACLDAACETADRVDEMVTRLCDRLSDLTSLLWPLPVELGATDRCWACATDRARQARDAVDQLCSCLAEVIWPLDSASGWLLAADQSRLARRKTVTAGRTALRVHRLYMAVRLSEHDIEDIRRSLARFEQACAGRHGAQAMDALEMLHEDAYCLDAVAWLIHTAVHPPTDLWVPPEDPPTRSSFSMLSTIRARLSRVTKSIR